LIDYSAIAPRTPHRRLAADLGAAGELALDGIALDRARLSLKDSRTHREQL
jgi:hypothetical protein